MNPGRQRMVKSLSKDNLISFQEAIFKDYGVKLEDQELYDSAFNLLQFIESLIKFSEKDKTVGSKVVLDNPLNIALDKSKIK